MSRAIQEITGKGRVFIVPAVGPRIRVFAQSQSNREAQEATPETTASLDPDQGERTTIPTPGFGTRTLTLTPTNPFLEANVELERLHRSGGSVTIDEESSEAPEVLQLGVKTGSDRKIAITTAGVMTLTGSGLDATNFVPGNVVVCMVDSELKAVVIQDRGAAENTYLVKVWGEVVSDDRSDAYVPTGQRRAVKADDREIAAAVSATHQYFLAKVANRATEVGRVGVAGGVARTGAGTTSSPVSVILNRQHVNTMLIPAQALPAA